MVYLKVKNKIAFVEWDDPRSSVNVLSEKSLSEFSKILDEISDSVQVVILISKKPSVFIAGADLKEIQTLKTQEEFSEKIQKAHDLFQKMEKSSRTFISAVHGACLGGGTELALACDYRIASLHSSTNIGLPEVQLGFIPGFGGTARLPRLIGFVKALDMILTGKAVSAKKAHKLGLVDEIEGIPSLLRESAEEFAFSILKGEKPRKRKTSAPHLPAFLRSFIVFFARRGVLKKTKGFYPAPLKALQLLHKTYAWPLEKALAEEKKVFCELAVTEISRNLVRLFFMTEEIKKKTGFSGEPKKTAPLCRTAVLGAGVMGSGIAYVCADQGFETRLFDLKKEQLLKGRNQAYSLWKKQLQRRKINKFEKEMRQSRMSFSLDGGGFSTVDLLIEAVVENMEVKKQVIKDWSSRLKEGAVFASNTSSLSVNKMSQFYKDPSCFIGLHFFNPVYKMPLVEIIKGGQTSDETTARVFQFVKKLGKKPVIVKDSPGFLVNRLLMPWLSESLYLLEEGLGIRTIDQTFLKWGFPMGPFRLMDEVGLDVCVQVIKSFIHQGLKLSVPSFVDKLAVHGALGKKTALGFYHYTSEGKARAVNKGIESLIDIQGRSLKKEDVLKRGLYRMINECAFVLEEKVVSKPETIDLAMIMGAGFPPFYGGPLRYAQQEGVGSIVKDLEKWCGEGLTRFKPADLLAKLSVEKTSLYD